MTSEQGTQPMVNEQLKDLLQIIHISERITAKLNDATDAGEIFQCVTREFTKSRKYNVAIFLLSEDDKRIYLATTSFPERRLWLGEQIANITSQSWLIDRSTVFQQVLREGKTVDARFDEVVQDYWPPKLVQILLHVLDYHERRGILTPIKRKDKIIGFLVLDSIDLAEHLVPSIINLTQHISMALERIDYIAELKKYAELLESLVDERTRALSESEYKYRSLVENAPIGIFQSNLQGHWIYANAKLAEIYGYTSPDELMSFPLIERYASPEDREEYVRRIQQLGVVTNYEHRTRTKAGTIINILESAVLRDESLIGMVMDISEKKRLEQQLLETRKMAGIGETAAMVGHDLRNPLQAIVGNIYLLRQMQTNSPKMTQELTIRLDIIEQQIKYMNKIVTDLQDFARPLNPEPISAPLYRILNQVLTALPIPNTIKVTFRVPKHFHATLDPELMQRVFNNLITNAIQAMPTGGELTITASKTVDTLLISIRDTGLGITPKALEQIWHPLFTTKPKGQGFGLPVAKRIIDAHKGTIHVESNIDQGSVFTIQIPNAV